MFQVAVKFGRSLLLRNAEVTILIVQCDCRPLRLNIKTDVLVVRLTTS